MTERPQRFVGARPKGGATHVRVAPLEDTLEKFNAEIGQRVTHWFVKNLQPAIASQEMRIRVLEWKATPWWRKLLFRLAQSKLGLWFTAKYAPKKMQEPEETPPEPEKAPEIAESAPETVPEAPPQRETRTCAKCGQRFIVKDDKYRICPICRVKEEQ